MIISIEEQEERDMARAEAHYYSVLNDFVEYLLVFGPTLVLQDVEPIYTDRKQERLKKGIGIAQDIQTWEDSGG